MPDGLIPTEGLALELKRLTNPGAMTGRLTQAQLWSNDLTPTLDTVLADLVFGGFSVYSLFSLDDEHWSEPELSGGCAISTWTAGPLTWDVTSPGGATIYGWALIDATAGVLRGVQRFDDADIRPLEAGDHLVLVPQMLFSSHPCSGAAFRAGLLRARKRKGNANGRASVQPLSRRREGR